MSGVQSASGIPSAPHPKVRALYGYEYISSDGRVIKMTEGEEFFLLKKANEDWWQVKRPTESKPIYVPATYVEEKPIEQSPVLKTFGKMASFNGGGSGLRNGSTDQPTSPKSKIVATISLPLNPYEGFRGSVLMQDDSEYAEITFKEEETTHLSTGSSQSPSPLPISPLAMTARSSSPVYTNLEELKQVQGTDFPPTPTGEPIVTSEDSWETHLDESSNRFFYRNLLSGEMSWKPPRRARPPTPPPDYSPSQSSLAAAPQAILPPGWQEEMDAKGEISFTHLASPDKWKRLMDENGKVYFYTSKGDSVWELPKLESPPPPEEPRAGTLPRASHPSERSLHSSTLPRGTGTSSSSSFLSSSSAAMTQDVKPALSSFGMATLPRASVGSSDRQFGTGAGGSSSSSSGIGSTTSALAATSLVATLRPGGPDKPQLVLTEQGTVTAVNWRVRQSGLDRAILAKSVFIPDEPKITPHKRTLSDHDLSDKAAPATVNPLSPPLDKAGMLNKTKIMEAGKKLRKNWAPSWVVLSGSSLVFHKEPKAQTAASWKPGSAQSKPEGSVELRGAHVEWARDKSSKKNVFQIQAGTGYHEFLLQSDNDAIINEWFQAIRSVIQKLSSEPGNRDEVFLSVVKFGGNFDEVDGSGGEEESSESPLREKSKDSKKHWAVSKPAVVESTDKKKAKRKLMKFFPKRPPIQSLRDKGLIKEQVFGCPLAMLCERENTAVPKFVQLSIETVDKRGLCIDGIYRVSGNLATIQKLRFLVDHEEKVSLDESHWEDIHVITGALKMFFRELPEPLFPFNQFDLFISAIKNQDSREKLTKIKEQVQKLPKPNKDTMKALFEHLKKVIACGEANRMTTQSVAIVFGPTLLRPENESSSMAFHLVYQNQIVEFILSEFTTIFGL